jgi:hypothetical protein
MAILRRAGDLILGRGARISESEIGAFLEELSIGVRERVQPVVSIGWLDDAGRLHMGSAGGRGLAEDGGDFIFTLDHPRRLQTYSPPWWVFHPAGRWLALDDFNDAPEKFAQAAGTVTRTTTRNQVFEGTGSLLLTAAAGIGNLGHARRILGNPADLPKGKARLYLQAYVAPLDTNVASIRGVLEVESLGTGGGRRRIEWRLVRTGANAFRFDLLDSSGTMRTIESGIGLLDGGTATIGNAWHLIGLVLEVDQSPAALRYVSARVDDRFYDRTVIAAAAGWPADDFNGQSVGAATRWEADVQFIVENNSAGSTANASVDGFALGDLVTISTW